ncbi:MAG TPA: anti-sigma factor [Methylomirabilota bacterium]|nr:anti-sigma factor [Methylomirabilota bacterium]
MSVSHEPFDTMASLHAVRALDGEDLREFQEHLAAGCGRCAAVVRQTEQALARAAMAGPPELPPPSVREQVMRRATTGRGGSGRWLPWAIGILVAAVAAGAFSAAYVAARYEAQLGQMARETAAARERVARSEAALREEMDAYRTAVELLRDPATRQVDLRGQAAAGATGRLLWTDKLGGLLVATKLPPVAPGKAYALWTLEDNAPRAAGIFVPDEAGRATLKVAAPASGAPIKVLSVTLEPAEGVPAPTGAVVLAPR